MLEIHEKIEEKLDALQDDEEEVERVAVKAAAKNGDEGYGQTFESVLNRACKPAPKVQENFRELTTAFFAFVANPVQHVKASRDATTSERQQPAVLRSPRLAVEVRRDALEQHHDEGDGDAESDEHGDVCVELVHRDHGGLRAGSDVGDARDANRAGRVRRVEGLVAGEELGEHVPVGAVGKRGHVEDVAAGGGIAGLEVDALAVVDELLLVSAKNVAARVGLPRVVGELGANGGEDGAPRFVGADADDGVAVAVVVEGFGEGCLFLEGLDVVEEGDAAVGWRIFRELEVSAADLLECQNERDDGVHGQTREDEGLKTD